MVEPMNTGDALSRARSAVKRLKVFPLPSVVLLPGGAQPLHVFEQRYRRMVKDALDSDAIFAMAQVVPGQEGGLEGKPMLDSIVCVGVITLHEELDEGRFNVMLVGVARARIKRELPQTHLYREVEAELLEDEPYAGPEEEELREAVLDLIARVPNTVGQRVAQLTARSRGGQLADVVAATIHQDVGRRLEVLEQLDVRQRIRSIADDLTLLIARIKPKKPEGLLN